MNKRKTTEKPLTSITVSIENTYGLSKNFCGEELHINIVPASLKRLLAAKERASESTLSGIFVRIEDVSSNVEGIFGQVFLFLAPCSTAGNYLLRVHCACYMQDVFITAYAELSEKWFQQSADLLEMATAKKTEIG